MMERSSEFQEAIAIVESLPLDDQETLITLIQDRLREKRRQ